MALRLIKLLVGISMLILHAVYIVAADAPTIDDKTYVFALKQYPNTEEFTDYDRDTGEITGFVADLINAVCKDVNKKCEFYWIHGLDSNQCWDSRKKYSEGLLYNWFDACGMYAAGSDIVKVNHFFGGLYQAIYTGQLLANDNNRNQEATKSKIGLVMDLPTDLACLTENGIVPQEVNYYKSAPELNAAIMKGEVHLGFQIDVFARSTNLTVVQDNITCAGSLVSLMTRKEKRNMMDWFDVTLNELVKDGTYTKMCEDFRRSTVWGDVIRCLKHGEY